MGNPLYDRELDAVPPPGGAALVPASFARASAWRSPSDSVVEKGKGHAAEGAEYGPLARWFADLSLPGLIGVGLAAGIILSTAVVVTVRPGEGGVLLTLLAGLATTPAITWALRRSGSLAHSWPARRRPRPRTGPSKVPLPRDLGMPGSVSRKLSDCARGLVLAYLGVCVTAILCLGLGLPTIAYAERYAQTHHSDFWSQLFRVPIVLNGWAQRAMLIVVCLAWYVGFAFFLLVVEIWGIVGTLVLLVRTARRGWMGWYRSISVVLDPMIEAWFVGIAIPATVLRVFFRGVWHLIGWAPPGDEKPDPGPHLWDEIDGPPPDESKKPRAAENPGRTILRSFGRSRRGTCLGLLGLVAIPLGLDILAMLGVWLGLVVDHARGRLPGGSAFLLEALAPCVLLVAAWSGLAWLLRKVRGPRIGRAKAH